MRANPIHDNPQVAQVAYPAAPAQGKPHPVHESRRPQLPPQAHTPNMAGASGLPQVTVDYQAVRLIKKEVGERLTSLLRARPGMNAATQEQQGRA